MSTNTISATTATLLRRTFASMPKEEALRLFAEALESDTTPAHEVLDSLVSEILTERNGLLIKSAELALLCAERVPAGTFESVGAFQRTLVDVLSDKTKYAATKGPYGGIRLASVEMVSVAKPKAAKAPKASKAAAEVEALVAESAADEATEA